MAFKLQIKRSTTNPGTSALSLAELGYQTTAQRLFVGNASGGATEFLNATDVTTIQTALQTAINGKANNTVNISAGNHLTGGGTLSNATVTLNHATPGTQSASFSVDNSNGNVIQDLSVDAFGHIRALPVSINLDDRYYTETEINALGTTTATANKWVVRDANGKAFVTSPISSDGATTVATKGYVDGLVQGLDVKDSVFTANSVQLSATGWVYSGNTTLTYNSPLPLENWWDNNTLTAGQRVLVRNHETASANGIYNVTTSTFASPNYQVTLTRSNDALNGATATGNFTFVESGDVYGDTGWVVSSGSAYGSGIFWTQFSSAGVVSVSGGTTITVSQVGTVFTVNHGTISTTASEVNTEASTIVRALTYSNGHITGYTTMATLDCGAY
jgi:hypothetical protein